MKFITFASAVSGFVLLLIFTMSAVFAADKALSGYGYQALAAAGFLLFVAVISQKLEAKQDKSSLRIPVDSVRVD